MKMHQAIYSFIFQDEKDESDFQRMITNRKMFFQKVDSAKDMQKAPYPETSSELTCTRCKATKSSDEYSNDRYAKFGKRSQCKECERDVRKLKLLLFKVEAAGETLIESANKANKESIQLKVHQIMTKLKASVSAAISDSSLAEEAEKDLESSKKAIASLTSKK